MKYSSPTQELTNALQELTAKKLSENDAPSPLPKSLPVNYFTPSKEIEQFVEQTQDYSKKTRSVCVGSY